MYSITNNSAILKYNTVTIGWGSSSNRVTTIVNGTENRTTYIHTVAFTGYTAFRAGRVAMFVPRFSFDNLNINSNPYLEYTYDSAAGKFQV